MRCNTFSSSWHGLSPPPVASFGTATGPGSTEVPPPSRAKGGPNAKLCLLMAIQAKTVMFTGPRQLEVQYRSLPDPTDDQVVVRTLYSGVSAGTEMNVFRGLAPQWHTRRDPATGLFADDDGPDWSYPMAYGYAAVGRIETIGTAVPRTANLSVGDLVFTYTPHCSVSVVPWGDLVVLPTSADPRLGVFIANLNTALNGTLDARASLGDVVVVSGLGVIGLIVVQLLRRNGVASIVGVDPIEQRRLLAKHFGADVVLSPNDGGVADHVRALTDNRGADIVIEVSGAASALNEAIRTVGYNGRVIVMSWYGANLDSLSLAAEFHHNRPRLISSQVGAINQPWPSLVGTTPTRLGHQSDRPRPTRTPRHPRVAGRRGVESLHADRPGRPRSGPVRPLVWPRLLRALGRNAGGKLLTTSCCNIEERLSPCVEWLFAELDAIEDRVAAAAKQHLRQVEFWYWRRRDVDHIAKALSDNGVGVSAVVVDPQADIADRATHDPWLANVRDSAKAAAFLHSPILVATAGLRATVPPTTNKSEP